MTSPKDRWLSRAKEDRAAADMLLRGGMPALACFHAQQAAEKALKGFLVSKRALGTADALLAIAEPLL